jgi:cytochrome c oxidase subunit 2
MVFLLLVVLGIAWFVVSHTIKQRNDVSLSDEEKGRILVETNECRDCHRPNDPFKAPTFEGLFGAEVDLIDGRTVVADEEYISDAILNPGKHIAYGYQDSMPTYKGKLKDQDIKLIVRYFTSLSKISAASPSPGTK